MIFASVYADDSSWLDFEARIQYAYYIEDERALNSLVGLLAAEQDESELAHYYRAFANYRVSQTRKGTDAARADAADRCVASLDRVLAKKADSAEPLALQAACLSALSKLRPLRARLAASRSRTHVAQAMRLAPKNPRAMLVASAEQEAVEAQATLLEAVRQFETERQDVSKAPGWGAADAYLELGRICLDRGEVLGARDALEHALLIAPDFAAARRLLSQITSG